MGATRAKKVEKKLTHSYSVELKCNDCELIVRLTSEQQLTDAHKDELQARILCTPCEKKRLDDKK